MLIFSLNAQTFRALDQQYAKVQLQILGLSNQQEADVLNADILQINHVIQCNTDFGLMKVDLILSKNASVEDIIQKISDFGYAVSFYPMSTERITGSSVELDDSGVPR